MNSFAARVLSVFLFVFLLIVNQAQATHLRAGQITVRVQGRVALITIEVWTFTGSAVLFGGDQDVLDFGDGTSMLIEEQANRNVNSRGEPLPPDVGYASITVSHTYEASGFFVISYREPNRNEGVVNMDNSVNTTFYLETKILIDPAMGDNNSPVLAIDPIDRACPGVAFFHNPGASDPDFGDSIAYVEKIPNAARNQTVTNYRDPDNSAFYTDYNNGREGGGGPPNYSINDRTGTITWDAPGRIGEYNIAFHVVEYKRINGRWREIGYVRRDMQIIVEDCDNERPRLELPPDTCVIAGTLLEETIQGTDPDGDPVKIQAFSPIFAKGADGTNSIFDPPATIAPDPGDQETYVPQPTTTDFQWQTKCLYVRDQPYFVVFKITDKPANGPQLATYETWSIKVVGPKPVWDSYSADEVTRSVTLNWENYAEQFGCDNAVAMQVWRKVDGSDFEPDNCQTGMPPTLGYELVGTVPLVGASATTFTDTNNGQGLEVGPRYCYRLVAVFPAETQALSLVSDDICIEPFDLVDPVITNVDVDRTSETEGTIIVRWTPPLQNANFPSDHPFVYQIWKGDGFSGDSVALTTTSDTVYVHDNIDTQNQVHNYTIHAYSDNSFSTLVGSSSQASSVRLEARSELDEIEISWSATVPWTNSLAAYTHKVYRGGEGAESKDDLELIDEVFVTVDGFIYEDKGQWNGVPLEKEQTYCYMVETYGSYGNPLLPEPLINRSQVICTQPGDAEKPCTPAPPQLEEPRNCSLDLVTTDDCAGTNQFVNKLVWTRDDSDCASDIAYYKIYSATSIDGDYGKGIELPPGVTTYEDVLFTSYARCYRISAVDRSGNESALSEPFCVDNCPYYELPNVFTPNGDGCNDLFRAYNNVYGSAGEGPSSGDCDIPIESQRKCARFVEKVVFHVYNRWGREVYTYTGQVGGSGDTPKEAILINWDGKSNEGQELSTGVYYYVADVTFISIDPATRNKTLKGWIHLIRSEQ